MKSDKEWPQSSDQIRQVSENLCCLATDLIHRCCREDLHRGMGQSINYKKQCLYYKYYDEYDNDDDDEYYYYYFHQNLSIKLLKTLQCDFFKRQLNTKSTVFS